MPTTSLSIAPLLVLLAPVAAFAANMPPAAAPPPRPNILIAIADDWSYPHAGAYGCTWVKTPAFDRVAREGALFTRAYTPNAKCAPSRSCLLTGRNSWQLQEAANHWCFWYGATEPHRAYEYGSDRFWDLAFGKRGEEELYDLSADPDCLNNLAAAPAQAERRAAWQKQLFTELTAQGDPRLRGEGDVFDQYPCADLSDRGFYERFMRGETKKLPGWVEPTDFEKQPVK